MKTGWAIVGAIALALEGLVSEAAACSMASGSKPPSLIERLTKSPVVFIRTVVTVGSAEKVTLGSPPHEGVIQVRRTTFKVDIPLRGVATKLFEVRQGMTTCDNQFRVGEHWLYVGSKKGSGVFGGSTQLRRQTGKEFPLAPALRDALVKVFPDAKLD